MQSLVTKRCVAKMENLRMDALDLPSGKVAVAYLHIKVVARPTIVYHSCHWHLHVPKAPGSFLLPPRLCAVCLSRTQR